MKFYFLSIIAILIGCQQKSEDENVTNSKPTKVETKETKPKKSVKLSESDKRFRDSLYNRESDNYISKLEEISGRDTGAYKLTITSKKDQTKFTKVLDVRPRASHINYCNDLYTVVGFSCGGPCSSQVFVFTDETRPSEQFTYVQSLPEHPNIIAHIENEEFEKLIVHNFDNSKELVVDNSDIHLMTYGRMDTLYIVGNNLKLEYQTANDKIRKKTVSLRKILN